MIDPAHLEIGNAEQGFGLAEFMMSALMMIVILAGVFELIGRVERTAAAQGDVQGVVESTRIGMETVERILRQAGNDPLGAGFPGLEIISSSSVIVRSDLTGAGPGSGDRGDPDGDIEDSGEQTTIRFNAASRSLEIVPQGGTAQPVAGYITAFLLEYFDQEDAPATAGNQVRRIRITLTGAAPAPDPQTGRTFSLQLTGEVRIPPPPQH